MPCHLFRRRIPQFEKLTGYCFTNPEPFRRRLPNTEATIGAISVAVLDC
jgi:hypothetical protein